MFGHAFGGDINEVHFALLEDKNYQNKPFMLLNRFRIFFHNILEGCFFF